MQQGAGDLQSTQAYFSGVTTALRSRVTRYAWYGLAIALAAVVLATLVTVSLAGDPITSATIVGAQRATASLLVLDLMPFLFMFWGQYVGVVLSHHAGAMVLDHTETLRTDKRALETQARRLGQRDDLTGLGNRTFFLAELDKAIERAHLRCTRVGILLVDLDGFSEVNDEFGAAIGDRVLQSVAQRLDAATDESALVARLGGDSFGIIADEPADPQSMEAVARRVEQALAPPCAFEQLSLNIAASIGAAVFPDHERDAYSLLNAADAAMQHVKTRGGGFEWVATRQPPRDAAMRSLSADLRDAIEDDQLVVHLQPIVDARSREVAGVEALVRWQHPRRGLLLPGQFVRRAERIGVMRDLSMWVLRQSLEHAARLHAAGWPLRVSVNLSARSLLEPEFPEMLSGLLTICGLPAERLVLEITEDTLMTDQRRALEVATRIAELGVAISIDDFGTGYSQLAYLKRLPVTELKIDRTFIQDMLVSKTDRSIVAATIGLAHALGMRAVGEGVESEAQRERLGELGCDLIQGRHIGAPMASGELDEWLEAQRPSGPASI